MEIQYSLLPAWITLFIAVVVSAYWFIKLAPAYKLLSLFLWVTAAANVASLHTSHVYTNLSILPALSLATLLIFSRVYLEELLKERPLFLLIAIASAAVIVLFDIYFSYNGLSVRHFFALGTVATDLCIVLFCLYYFWKSLREEAPLNRDVWSLNSAFLIYFSISSLLFFSINFLINESLKVVAPFWMLNAFSASFLYSFLSYKIWQNGRQGKRRSTES